MNYAALLKKQNLTGPLAFVDLNRFDENAKTMAKIIEGTPLKIRIATKSIRVPELIKRALDSSSAYQGLMCYSVQEAAFLADLGFDDLLIAYPSISLSDLQTLKGIHASKKVSMVFDDIRQLKVLDEVLKGSVKPFSVILELDLSFKLGSLVVGVRRSPLKTAEKILTLIRYIKRSQNLRFQGLMAYEAHVAGVGDQNPFKTEMNLLMKPMRLISAQTIVRKRKQILDQIRSELPEDFVFNGGGTGSLSFNRAEDQVLTELTAGSGFYCPHLFDNYSNVKLKPAAFFALQIVRESEKNWYTCLGGGFVASGEPGWDRVPMIYSPNEKMSFSKFEAAGEVQTPVKTEKNHQLGDSLIFRHAKAGELMERFNHVSLIENGEIKSQSKTYRGYGECYF